MALITTTRQNRTLEFLRKADLDPAPNITPLARLSDLDSSPSESDLTSARSLLVEQRISQPDFRQPDQKKRYFLKSQTWKKEKGNVNSWVFTKHEVSKAFGSLLGRKPLAPVTLAQALVSHIGPTTVDELWRHLHDQKLGKKPSRRSFARRSTLELIPQLMWLDWATQDDHLDYMHMLCRMGVTQAGLDRAFKVALSKKSMRAMTILLRSGAVATSSQADIQEHIRLDNIEIAELLLSAPHAMTADAWRVCLQPELQKNPPRILLRCLAHRPDIVNPQLLLESLVAGNLASTAVILAYAESYQGFYTARKAACEVVCRVINDETRLELFSLLAMIGLLTDVLALQQELMKNVKTRQLGLIRLLVLAGVSVDIEPNNAISFVISSWDLEVLECFRQGVFTSPVSPLLNLAPESASESDMLQVVNILGQKGLAAESLDSHLVRAVRKQHTRLVETLLAHGASIEYQQAFAVRTALENANFDLLHVLLLHECAPVTLSAAVTVAMNMETRPARLKAMQILTQKGVLSQELGIPLQKLTSEPGEVDYELIRLILQFGAPVDNVGDDNTNALFIATRRGLVPLLQLLCAAGPKGKTLSRALPIAFNAIHTHNYGVAYDMLKLLLESGAKGDLVHQTLLDAANKDEKLEIVQLLLDAGADTNYRSGSSFVVALVSPKLELFQRLCTSCPPTATSTKFVLFLAPIQYYFNARKLDLLLSATPNVATVLDSSWSWERFSGNANRVEIVRCFLRHGMNVNIENGILLSFAVQERNLELLSEMLSANPSRESLITGFREATGIEERNLRFLYFKPLLRAAGSAEIGQSAQLPQETVYSLMGDFAIFELVLGYNADVDFEEGISVGIAAAAASSRTLTLLLSRRPALHSLHRACLATAWSAEIGSDQKRSVFKQLLDINGGVTVEAMTKILVESVKNMPDYTQLPKLLLSRGAAVDFELIKFALTTASQELFTMLASTLLTSDIFPKLFRYARFQNLPADRRYWTYKYLLERGVTKDDISEALLSDLKRLKSDDLSLIKLLLEYGAPLNYKGGAALVAALNLNSIETVSLLSQYFDDETANLAFALALKNTSLSKDTRYGVYQCFLAWPIEISHVQNALVANLCVNLWDPGVDLIDLWNPGIDLIDSDIVDLLLEHGADPNKNGALCFVMAARRRAENEFRTLSRYPKPNLELILQALLRDLKEEWEVVRWFSICLEEHSNPTRISRDELLFQCMRKFPNENTLLKLLLDLGVSASAKDNVCLCPDWQPEVCTALIWAICSSAPRIGNNVILALIDQGDAALPTYSTPNSTLTAAFACVLDETRTDVLEALLNHDIDGVINHTMLESKFTYLAAYPEAVESDPNLTDNISEINLRVASAYTGNFAAFHLLRFENRPNDGMLITAVMLALPKFVEWLLANGHDPNYRSDETNMMIPLAMVCLCKYMASCKIANKESNLLTRQKQTMRLLAKGTDLSFTYRKKTVLHFAFEAGPDVTEAMVEALEISWDPKKDEKYLYIDKEGIRYSPDEYVKRLMTDLGAQEKTTLLRIVEACGLISCYYRDVEPGQEKGQPEGYKGLPPRLQALWAPPVEVDKHGGDKGSCGRRNGPYGYAGRFTAGYTGGYTSVDIGGYTGGYSGNNVNVSVGGYPGGYMGPNFVRIGGGPQFFATPM